VVSSRLFQSSADGPTGRSTIHVVNFPPMASSSYYIQADWDHEAGVWVATSEDVPGLATESETLEALTAKLRSLIPELLEANLF
jgi:predicted RNase H-like HicB family nuclease